MRPLASRSKAAKWIVLLVLSHGGLTAFADEPQQAKTAKLVYKRQPRRTMTVYYPDGWQATDRRAVLVIFRCRIPAQREYFRKLGMVIIKPQLAPVNSGSLPGVSLEEIAKLPKPRHQVEDARSSIRFIRQQAEELGIEPNRIVATGTSGGGDLALQTHLNRAFEDPSDNKNVSASPDALVLYCPAFDGIDIWFVKSQSLREQTRAKASAFLPLLDRFVTGLQNDYVVPRDHRKQLIELAAKVGKEEGIAAEEVARFQEVLQLFNERDWQLLHSVDDALKMSASRILTRQPLPPTLIMFGERDHLVKHQRSFVARARELGQEIELKTYPRGGHSFMMQPAFEQPSTKVVEAFLRKHKFLP